MNLMVVEGGLYDRLLMIVCAVVVVHLLLALVLFDVEVATPQTLGGVVAALLVTGVDHGVG
ncbi:hypothetical protein AAGG49_22420, partial [Stenotrophomonas maltophilia]|uniref:hypothetical protein n=1 Tax=Stenotrophomonas maltophilia TaxID=40324 RepID=UPI00313DC748